MSKIIVLLILFSSFFIFASPARAEDKEEKAPYSIPAQADFNDLRLIGTVKVSQVIDGLTLRLDDNRIIQLSGLDLPDLTPYEAGDIAVAAQNALDTLITGKNVTLYQTKSADKGRTNRMGYELAHLELTTPATQDNKEPTNIWVQGYLALNGLARVRPTERNPEMAAQMYDLEKTARNKKAGLWDAEKYAAFQVMAPDSENITLNSFAVVEGKIKSVAIVKNTIYMNFGNNWRDDFTIGIESPIRRQIAKERPSLNLLSLGGTSVRVRGWVESYNGPFIRLEHPALIEFLPAAAENTNLDAAENN